MVAKYSFEADDSVLDILSTCWIEDLLVINQRVIKDIHDAWRQLESVRYCLEQYTCNDVTLNDCMCLIHYISVFADKLIKENIDYFQDEENVAFIKDSNRMFSNIQFDSL